MSDSCKRKPVVFNMENESHKELYNWCMSKTNNFSDFTRTVLFLYKHSQTSQMMVGSQDLGRNHFAKSDLESDADAMSSML